MLLDPGSYLRFASYHCELLADYRRRYETSPETLPATMSEFRRDLLAIKEAQASTGLKAPVGLPAEPLARLCAAFPRAGAEILQGDGKAGRVRY